MPPLDEQGNWKATDEEFFSEKKRISFAIGDWVISTKGSGSVVNTEHGSKGLEICLQITNDEVWISESEVIRVEYR